jgi:hypothetical protein
MTSPAPSQARAAALRATADRHRRAGKEWLGGGGAVMSPEATLAWHFMQRAQARAPDDKDARRAGPTSFDRQAAHEVITALREAGWRITRMPRP